MNQVVSPSPLPKAEYPPLLDAGIKYMSMDMLHNIAVEPFRTSVRRPILFSNLQIWLSRATILGLKGELWVDGSFLTEKKEPNDIDCVLIIDAFPSDISAESVRNVSAHLDKSVIAAQYGMDLYLVARTPQTPEKEKLSYWRGWFGYCRDGITAKGIARIEL